MKTLFFIKKRLKCDNPHLSHIYYSIDPLPEITNFLTFIEGDAT